MRLSITSIGVWLTCRRRWELEKKWEPPTIPTSLAAGSLFHDNLARKQRNEPLNFSSPLLDRCEQPDVAVARAKAGVRLWKDEIGGQLLQVESWLEAEAFGIRWVGRLDAIRRLGDSLFIVDHKLTSNPHWDWYRTISDQLLFYAWLAKQAGIKGIMGGIWDIVVVPNLRRRNNESLEEFENRLVDESLSRGSPVVTIPTTFTESDLAFIEEEIRLISEEIRQGKIFRNPQACAAFPCPYQLICRADDTAVALGFLPKNDLTEPLDKA
jgi:hypothetical protein